MNRYISLIAAAFCALTPAKVHSQSSDNGKVDFYKLQYAWHLISTFYVDTINQSRMAEDAIVGMLEKLDPHSSYVTAKELKSLNEPLEGSFEGIGIEFSIQKDTLHVVNTISGGPSEKVGLRSNDRIVRIDSKNVAGIGIDNAMVKSLLRGSKGSKVSLDVLRKGRETLSFTVTRDKIPILSVDAAYMATPEVGFIKINRFGAKTYDEFREALQKLKRDGMKSLIIDLRGNGGGYLKAAFDIANELMVKDRMIVFTKGKANQAMEFKSTGSGIFCNEPLVVLVDESTASSSEILSGAIQDWDRGVIVGVRTFGKGLVQRPFSLPDGSEIRLTTAKYYTPSGRCIQKPYTRGSAAKYQEEIYRRYTNGELLNQDSIKHIDSLMFKTLVHGRKVYGGGGIIPDVFVPIDTTKTSGLHQKLLRSGTIHRFAVTLYENGEAQWKQYPDIESFKNGYAVTDSVLEQLAAEAAVDKVECTVGQLRGESLLPVQLKALLAQRIFGTSSFYEIINPEIDSYRRALEIITDKPQYNALLKGKVK